MNTGIQDAMELGAALVAALARGDREQLYSYALNRRPIAEEVVAFTDRLTRLATIGRGLRPLRNALLKLLAFIPAFNNQLAWRLSGLVNR